MKQITQDKAARLIIQILLPMLLLFFPALAQLPEIGSIKDIHNKSKVYIDADADNYKRISKPLEKPLILVPKPSDAEFIIAFETTHRGDTASGRTNLSYEIGEMTVYFYLPDKTKVIVWRDTAKTGLKWPSAQLTKRFLKALK